MVKKNWNITKSEGKIYIKDIITNILDNTPTNKLLVSEVLYLVNSRTKGIFKKNNKDKTITPYIKDNFGSFKNYISECNNIVYTNIDGNNYIMYKEIYNRCDSINENSKSNQYDTILDKWIIINDFEELKEKIE